MAIIECLFPKNTAKDSENRYEEITTNALTCDNMEYALADVQIPVRAQPMQQTEISATGPAVETTFSDRKVHFRRNDHIFARGVFFEQLVDNLFACSRRQGILSIEKIDTRFNYLTNERGASSSPSAPSCVPALGSP